LKNKYFCNMISNVYQNQIKLHDVNIFFMSNSVFKIMMKYNQNNVLSSILEIIKKYNNNIIVSNAIESLSMLNDANFDYVFENYKNIIKSQELELFFSSIIKIISKQNFIVNYWMCSRDKISSNSDTQFEILKKMSIDIYDDTIGTNIINYIGLLDSIDNKINLLLIGKIIDILQINKIVCKNLTE
jgi:hypothetical protein